MEDSGLSLTVTRPQSSTGRGRAAVSSALCPEEGEGLRPLSAHTPLTLHRYPVLPSIGRGWQRGRPSLRGEQRGGPSLRGEEGSALTEDLLLQRHRLPQEEADVSRSSSSEEPQLPDPGPSSEGPSSEGWGGLLLAVWAPCGRRFQQLFAPSDTLLTVRASAELRYGAQYGGSSLQDGDRPPRTFRDLNMTLAQSGVCNRTLLRICSTESQGGASGGGGFLDV